MEPPEHIPHMSDQNASKLWQWHERAAAELESLGAHHVSYLGLDLDIPRQVFPPSPVSDLLGRAVLDETQPNDSVLDMGTGSGNNALLAAQIAAEVIGVDINPISVKAARHNAELNGATNVAFAESDVFGSVNGHFDLIIFDPPFRWFKARNIMELAFADENYATLQQFMVQVKNYLRPSGRILLFFGTSGDLEYLHRLIDENGFERTTIETRDLEKDDTSVRYVTYRLTAKM